MPSATNTDMAACCTSFPLGISSKMAWYATPGVAGVNSTGSGGPGETFIAKPTTCRLTSFDVERVAGPPPTGPPHDPVVGGAAIGPTWPIHSKYSRLPIFISAYERSELSRQQENSPSPVKRRGHQILKRGERILMFNAVVPLSHLS